MKCLSLWQPWATLMEMGGKRIETRSWATLYRGPVLIHAAKRWNRELRGLCGVGDFVEVLGRISGEVPDLMRLDPVTRTSRRMPLGEIIAVGQLVDCQPVETMHRPEEGTRERAFGDYRPGRFAWMFGRVCGLSSPIPWRGMQGLFEVPDEVAEMALAEAMMTKQESKRG